MKATDLALLLLRHTDCSTYAAARDKASGQDDYISFALLAINAALQDLHFESPNCFSRISGTIECDNPKGNGTYALPDNFSAVVTVAVNGVRLPLLSVGSSSGYGYRVVPHEGDISKLAIELVGSVVGCMEVVGLSKSQRVEKDELDITGEGANSTKTVVAPLGLDETILVPFALFHYAKTPYFNNSDTIAQAIAIDYQLAKITLANSDPRRERTGRILAGY